MSSSLVVVVAAPGPVTAAVRDVLRDWSALGLVQPLLWIDETDARPGSPIGAVLASRISEGGLERVRLQDQLANTSQLGFLRLIALGALGAQSALVDPNVAGFLLTSLSTVTGGRLSPLQVILTRQGAGGWVDRFERPGWRSLVVAPEDAFTPNRFATELLESDDDTEPIAHAAAAVAATAGLWTGMETAAFDDAGAGVVSEPQVVRAFLRRLDTTAVSAALRSRLTDVSRGLPRPQTPQGTCSHLQSPATAAQQTATAVLGRHQNLLTVHEVAAGASATTKRGPIKAIADFLRFLWTALLRAPGDLAGALSTRVAQGVSSRVQQALYGGTDSRIEVVTRGVNSRGLPAGVGEISATARDVSERAARALQLGEQSLPDTSGLWRDVIAGGLTLADAGYERLPDVAPLVVNGLPGVVSETSWVAPAPADSFPLPSTVATQLGSETVSPYDVHAHDLAAQLMANPQPPDAAIMAAAETFALWRDKVESSYTGVLGRALASEVHQRATRLRELLEILRTGLGVDDEAALADAQRKVRRIIRNFLIGVLVIAAITTGLKLFTALTTTALVLIATGLFVTWLVHLVLSVIKQQSRIFALIHRRADADRRLEYAAKNVGYAAQGLYVATSLYGQYLAWAPVLGRFLREPFGSDPAVPEPLLLDGVLPRAVGFGVARPDETAIETVAAELAPAIFERGWLSGLWKAFVDDAPDVLGPIGTPLRSDPSAMLLADPATEADSLLRQWSAIVSADGPRGGAGQALWERARGALSRRGLHAMATALFPEVDVQAQAAHQIDEPRNGATFFTELTDSLADAERHAFLPSLFTPTAAGRGAHRVSMTVAFGNVELAGRPSASTRWLPLTPGSATALDQFLVVVQATSPLPSSELKLEGGQAPSVERPAPAPADDTTLI